MSVFLFKAVPMVLPNGQKYIYPAGARTGFLINLNGTLDQAKQYARANHMGSPRVKYLGVELMPASHASAQILGQLENILAVETSFGVQIAPGQPMTSAQHVNGGQPTGAPMGNINQNRQSGIPDKSGFQVLGDDVLSGAGETLMGNAEDGTSTDLYGGGRYEAPRT